MQCQLFALLCLAPARKRHRDLETRTAGTARISPGRTQVFCESARPEAERLKAQTNPHSSTQHRVIGPLSNMPEFQKAFSCGVDASMVRHTAGRVW